MYINSCRMYYIYIPYKDISNHWNILYHTYTPISRMYACIYTHLYHRPTDQVRVSTHCKVLAFVKREVCASIHKGSWIAYLDAHSHKIPQESHKNPLKRMRSGFPLLVVPGETPNVGMRW